MNVKRCKTITCTSVLFLLLFIGAAFMVKGVGEPASTGESEKPRETRKRKRQDRIGKVPQTILSRQSLERVKMPPIDKAVKTALTAAQEASFPLIDTKFHDNGKVIIVPGDYKSIQEAINAARSGDIVLVKPGIYYELLVMKDGVKLVSDSANKGDELTSVKGARLKLPRRTLRTIIDGSKAKPSKHGMIDFEPGISRKTIVDGFTIRNLPRQNHHIPGHAHGINVRGASPCIINCLIHHNGSTGIGNHVVFHDQDSPTAKRDFRCANVKYKASAVIYNNIVYGNLGLGIGCNHLSEPFILGNEVFDNSDTELGEDPSPGLGNKHGSAAVIIGNIVHNNPGGGILCKVGQPQGIHHIDRPTHTTIKKNVVYINGPDRPQIACQGGGSKEMPVKIINNYVYNAGSVGIALSKGAVGIIEENMVSDSKLPGISVKGSTALKLNHNKVTGAKKAPGFVILNGAVVCEMEGNASDSNQGPRFMLRGGTIQLPPGQ
jgi:parallel beta-helix repeat protein